MKEQIEYLLRFSLSPNYGHFLKMLPVAEKNVFSADVRLKVL